MYVNQVAPLNNKTIFFSATNFHIILRLLFSFSIILYLFSPESYSYGYTLVVFIFFLLNCLIYFRIRDNSNFFSFDFIFIIAFTFTYFIYPVFIFPINKNYFFMFNYSFNENVVTKATCLALIGFNAFLIGYSSVKKNEFVSKKTGVKVSNLLPTIFSCVFSLFHFFQLHILKVGLLYSGDGDANPAASGGIWGYITILRNAIFLTAISVEFYIIFRKCDKSNWYKRNIVLWLAILFDMGATLITGSRAMLSLCLMIFTGIAVVYDGISLKRILVLMLIGFTGLSLVVVLRSHGAFVFKFNIIDMAMDLIINNYTLFVGYDYVQNNGCVLFTLIGSLLSAIPMLQGFVVRTFGIDIYRTSSARFFSILALGNNPKFGVGTNIIGALYLATGFFGVIFFMFVLGKFVSYLSRDLKSCSLIKLLLYMAMMGNSVYLVRADYFYPVGKIVFALIFALLFTFSYIWKFSLQNKEG